MNRILIFTVVTVVIVVMLFFVKCDSTKYLDVSPDVLAEKIYEPTAVKLPALGLSVTSYLDHSTCVIDARQNSPVFQKLLGQLGLYTDTLCLIKGVDFETIPNTDKSPTSTDVYNIINGINEDIPFANIGQAVNNICNGNSQAVLITDCEYFDKNGKNQDGFPYLSGSFKKWLEKGHCIYIVTEPYQEKNKGNKFDKKRFYFFFTDDKMVAPISHNMLHELEPLIQDGLFTIFKMTNSDLSVQVQKGSEMFPDDLEISNFYKGNNFEYAEIDNDWNTIREYVMKLDEYGQPLINDEGTGAANPIPLVQNLVFNEGENYAITDVEVIATNITTQYANTTNTVIPVDITDGFLIDKDSLKNNKLNVFVTEKIFNSLTNEFDRNLIRLDFVVTKAARKLYDADIFTWQSLYDGNKATCVSKSIENVLADIEIVPISSNRRVIHTVFLNTQSYN
jgi:hypothetical protein